MEYVVICMVSLDSNKLEYAMSNYAFLKHKIRFQRKNFKNVCSL